MRIELSNSTKTDNYKILENEIASWHSFGIILRNESRIIFCQMLDDIIDTYSETVRAKGKNFSFESMCMGLILQQQRIINELLCKLSSKK
jgi:hypothetical protein